MIVLNSSLARYLHGFSDFGGMQGRARLLEEEARPEQDVVGETFFDQYRSEVMAKADGEEL